MPDPVSEPAVWSFLEKVSERVQKADLPGFKALFVIGSLPGAYFKPGQSDVDLLALLAGSRPDVSDYRKQAELLESLLGEIPEGLEVDILPRYESDLATSPQTGLYLRPDLVARLLVQSRLLTGSYDLSQLRMPGPADFQADFPSQLRWWQANHGAVEACAAPLQAKYLLLVLRTWLAVLRNQLIYNKTELIAAYRKTSPDRALPQALEHFLAEYLKGGPIKSGYEKELFAFCEQLSSEILSAQL